MTATSTKAIILNRAALAKKYQKQDALTLIDAALQRLVSADHARGIVTELYDIADAAMMIAIGASAVLSPADDRAAKLAVDIIFDTRQPDYILLLDGPDVIPHVALQRIPGINDADTTTDSDLPYASSASFSRVASSYLAVTRVVGRLPAARGETDESTLVGLIDQACNMEQRPASSFASYFAMTADRWALSTRTSLGNVFNGHDDLFVSPVDCHTAIDASLSKYAHLINCHGASGDWRFYGEKEGAFPIAMDATSLELVGIGRGAVVAMECCYGAQLYDYRLAGTRMPICLTYLSKGAAAVMGSTNVSYGPASTNGQADYMVQYFLQQIAKGSSTGRAMLEARQMFVQNQLMSNALNMKTLAQFLLLGDPSLHPVTAPKGPEAGILPADAMITLADEVDPATSRRHRRAALASEGKAIASSATRLGPSVDDSPAATRFISRARERGFGGTASVFKVTGGAAFRATAHDFGQDREIAIVMDAREDDDAASGRKFTSWRAIVGHIEGGRLFSIEECESK